MFLPPFLHLPKEADMSTATESLTTPFERTFENVRKAAESAIKMQQDMVDQWTKLWPAMAQSKDDWAGRIHKAHREWASGVTELMRKQRELWEEQFRAGIESLEDTCRLASAKDPVELRERFEAQFRKTMEVIKSTSETQVRNFQEAMQKWIELSQTKP
jgi:hypothetical protein